MGTVEPNISQFSSTIGPRLHKPGHGRTHHWRPGTRLGQAAKMDERLVFALWLSGAHTLATLVTWGTFSLMFRRGVARSAMVEEGRAPPPKLMSKAVRDMIAAQVAFVPLMAFVVHPLWSAAGGEVGGEFPGLLPVALHLLAYILINDTLFYWSHRTLHLPGMFKRFHVIHHRFRNVRGPVAEYAHPLESLANFVAFFAGPVLLGSPLWTVVLWVFIRMVETLEAHSGYALTNSASRHAFHHLNAKGGCYGSFFGWWDRLMGTDKQWRASGSSIT